MISPCLRRPASPAGDHSPAASRTRNLRSRFFATTRAARLRVLACALILTAGWCADAIVDMSRTNAVRQSRALIAQHLIERVASIAERTDDAKDFQAFALHVGRRPEILHFSIAAGSPPVIRASSDPSLLGADPELSRPATHDLRDLFYAADRHVTRAARDRPGMTRCSR